VRLLLITFDSKDELVPMLKFPPLIRKKSVAFVKRNPCALGAETMDIDVDVQDVAPSPLFQLAQQVSEVYLPILDNPKNQEKMPEVVAQDMKRHFQRLLANVSVALSQTKVAFPEEVAVDNSLGRNFLASAGRREPVQIGGCCKQRQGSGAHS